MWSIYRIFNQETGETVYTGQTEDVGRRYNQHFKNRNGKFYQLEDQFAFQVIEDGLSSALAARKREGYWQEFYNLPVDWKLRLERLHNLSPESLKRSHEKRLATLGTEGLRVAAKLGIERMGEEKVKQRAQQIADIKRKNGTMKSGPASYAYHCAECNRTIGARGHKTHLKANPSHNLTKML